VIARFFSVMVAVRRAACRAVRFAAPDTGKSGSLRRHPTCARSFRSPSILSVLLLLLVLPFVDRRSAAAAEQSDFFRKHCLSCHDRESRQGGFDLTLLPGALAGDELVTTIPAAAVGPMPDGAKRPAAATHDASWTETFSRWVKVYDRVTSGEMPPPGEPPLSAAEKQAFSRWLADSLRRVEQQRLGGQPRTGLRRLTRAEYEHTMRDLFDLPGIVLQNELPPDGTAHGFDKNSDALDLSHVNLAKYLEAADRTLSLAIAVQPQPPARKTQRISLANPHGFVAHVLMNGDGVLLKNKQVDPDFPAAAEHSHLDQGAHERMGSFHDGASVGLFRHEDESFHPYFNEFVAIYPARYRLRTSLWSFQWDQGKVLPGRGIEAARLSIVTLTGDGRGGGHPSTLLTHLDAPPEQERVHELTAWLNQNDTIGFNTASLAPAANYFKKRRAMEFTGPGIVCDYLEVDGPIFDHWPPLSHRRLFGDLPLVEFKAEENPGVRPPVHEVPRQKMFMGKNTADPVTGLWTVKSTQPLVDADRLLADFLPRAFRRPVAEELRRDYMMLVARRLEAGDCFEVAMRWAYRAALCSPQFLYHLDAAESSPPTVPAHARIDPFGLANRLAYFLWNSPPDDRLRELAANGTLPQPQVLKEEVERLLNDPRAQRFRDDFIGQWLKLRLIAATDPDRKLYPEFSVYLQDSMVAETRAYFREMLQANLNAKYLVQSDFAILNEKLARHYGIAGVSGCDMRRVPLPADSPRGPFLTQAALLKITANGTTTSPVPRGAFVMDRLLGRPPDPPPPNITAVEPDVRGTTTIREQLAKHRDHANCAACHARIDPPGFALEAFDVIGGQRSRYRSIGEGDAPDRGTIDPFIGLGFKLGPAVDSTGTWLDGRKFSDVREFQTIVAQSSTPLLANLAERLAVYSTGRATRFSDRPALAAIVTATEKQGGGIRTLIHELVQSDLFQLR
jgi:mono/diheme cytochrome c family protein